MSIQRKSFLKLSVQLLFAGSIFISCQKNKEAEVPSYISINQVELSTNYNTEGTSSQKITDAWVFLNDNFIGALELPTKVPLLANGSNSIQVQAGIKKNGIGSTRERYPFFNTAEIDVSLERNQSVEIFPTFTYREDLFFWLEDFDGVGFDLQIQPFSDTLINTITAEEEVFEGLASAEVFLNTDQNRFEAVTNEGFDFPLAIPVYLEMNYKSNNSMAIGIYYSVAGNTDKVYALVLNSTLNENNTPVWNKIYIDLTEAVNFQPLSDAYELFIEVQKDPGNSEAQVFFDNLKIVHP